MWIDFTVWDVQRKLESNQNRKLQNEHVSAMKLEGLFQFLHTHCNQQSVCAHLSTIGDRAFPVAASLLWNTLPQNVTSTLSLFSGRQRHITLIKRYKLHTAAATYMTKQPYVALVCRLMVSTPEIHLITWITTHLTTLKKCKSELAWLVDP